MPEDIPDQRGRAAIITGADTGLGFQSGNSRKRSITGA
jgi:hypothetical protein